MRLCSRNEEVICVRDLHVKREIQKINLLSV